MSAREALKAALAVGVEITLDGDDLLLEADTAPPPAVLNLLARHKAGIIALLRPASDDWSGEDWQVFFDERAGIAEYDGGMNRLDAEMFAFEESVDQWLALHPAIANQHGRCLRCGDSVSPEEQATVIVACSDGNVGRLHSGCAPTWKNLRRWDARSALIWLLDRTRTRAK